ncbi:MAG TPA: thiamine pyrophosphate-dependent dehydrogenase E1 component subunit alpha, partial [Conexibacter sp.]
MARSTTRAASEQPSEAAEAALALLRRMLLIRSFELEMQRQFLKGEVHGTTHLYNGQEAVSVGVCSQLRDGDYVAATYRGHGAALALGVPAEALAAELMGRTSGIDGGRGGSMNVIDISRGLVGCFGIVGGSIGAATGAALSEQRLRTGAVAVAFFGDGTSNQAYFHECLNWAQVEKLPVLFVCENNLYMEFTPIEEVTAGAIGARPIAMGIHTQKVDGNDLWAVREAAAEAIEHARSGKGPAFLETMTYRLVGHSRSDPGRYRRPGEMDEWKKRDPLILGR